MHNPLSRRLALPVVLALAVMLLASGTIAGAPMRSSWDARACGRIGGTLVFGQAQDAVGLDPADVEDGFSVNNTSNVFDTLVRFSAQGTQVEPSLAESWTVSPDGLVWTFKLRRGVRFHDGTPLDAKAVEFSFLRQFDKKNPYHQGTFAYAEFTLESVKSIQAVGTDSIRFTLKSANASFIAMLAMFSNAVSSPTAIRKYGKDYFKHPTGTGPFKFVEWVQKDHATYEANKEYWGGRPCVDRLIIRGIPDNTVRLLEMEKGSIQIMDQVNPPDYARIRGNSALTLFTGPGLNVGYVAMNVGKEPFNDVRIRRALNYAVNKPALVRAFYGGIAAPAVNPMPPTIWGYNHSVQPYEYSVAKAKQLLAEAGYPNGFSTELYWPNRARPYLTQPQKIAEALQSQLAQAGIRAKLVTFEWGTYLSKTRNGEHPMAILGWIGDNGDPDNFLYVLLDKDNTTVGKASNIAFYKSNAVHDLLIKAQQVTDQAQRAKYYEQAQVVIHNDAPWVPLVYGARVAAYRKQVQNFSLHPLQIFWLYRVWLNP
ncbi:MAG TPA: ABC transporter substrate-binding protein [bacterium]|nr:ABC transporter substrate-binding protein [bacterium]